MAITTETIETTWCVSPSGARSLLTGKIDSLMSSARINGYWRSKPAIIVSKLQNPVMYQASAVILFAVDAPGYKNIMYGWEHQFPLKVMMNG